MAANVELSVALNMSSPPEMAKLDVKESSQNRRQTLGNKLPAIPQFLLFAESSRLRRFPHFQLAVQYGYPNLNEQMSSLICPTHLPRRACSATSFDTSSTRAPQRAWQLRQCH
ncbi:MAG: hypothetical protein IPH54_21885 [Rhodoferax sp.]|nr:hypothetical protein [Rhodoferax sp.]